ncbi:MAG: OmpA family protein [Myxococcales bacterium]|nr:OmpA family protein [Myxococcales bacterium]
MRRWLVGFVVAAIGVVVGGAPSAAQAEPPRHSVRAEGGLVLPVTAPQRSRFNPGGGGALAYELRLVDWIGIEARVSAAWVPSSEQAPTVDGYGSYYGLPALGVRVYPMAPFGLGDLWLGASAALVRTGDVFRPGFEIGLGYEHDIRHVVRLGPFVRYQHVFQTDRALAGASDGGVLVIGLSVAYPGTRAPAPAEEAPRDRDGDGIADARDGCPDEPEDFDGFEDADGCPEADNDGDGVLDADDRCPMEPGSIENEGCPDADSDGDGIPDRLDACPQDAEDLDGFQDADGCPDPDNDGDGVLDADDRCVSEPGPAANRGCPDTDRDADGVPDRLDNCPDEPGSPANQGCPTQQLVQIDEGQLRILEVVYFATDRARIQRRSYRLLENVAAVLSAHPEIGRLRIEGHTDSRGPRESNMELSQRRAESVVRFLVERGRVAPERLEAQGFGPDQPVVADAQTEEDHAQNRRVIFRILQR